MGFAVGESVGPFEIIEYIGQGGMATIYKAHQTTLDRFVTLKVIHPALMNDQAFLNRLKREASIIAKLNHPNIVTVYDFTDFEGTPFLVLRYIDGKTLKEVLQQQRLGTQSILKIMRPVADALAYAHSRGVLHRDVKPSNILIDTEGHVYLTDFGLARIAYSSESTSSHDMMIGSPQYISPEQAKSEPVDARTDIYSLGIVLYEMFTGQVPFSAETPYGTILAQINEQPRAPRTLNPKIPAAVEQVLLKTIAKDPKNRYPSVREMMRALENAARGPVEETPAPIPLFDYKPARTSPLQDSLTHVGSQLKTAATSIGGGSHSDDRAPWIPILAGIAALILIFLCLAGGALVVLQAPLFNGSPTSRAPLAASTGVAEGILPTLPPSATSAPAELTPTPVPATLTPTPVPPQPTRTVTPVPTSAPTRPAVVPASSGAPRGIIAYSVATGELAEQHSIWTANADGSNAKSIIEFSLWPAISPNGNQIAYYRIKDEGIYIADINGANPQRITTGETCCVQWSPDSKRLMYVQGKLKIGDTHVKVVNLDGTDPIELDLGPSPYNPTWSPDASKIAYAACEQADKNKCGIFVYDMKTKASKMITTDGGGDPQWSPNSNRIVYQAGNPNVFAVNADGSGKKQLTNGNSNDGQPTWSSDGNFIFWRSDQNGKGWAIYVMRADGSDKRLLINNAPPDNTRWGYESLSAAR